MKDASESFKDKLLSGISRAVKIAPIPLIATVYPALPPELAIAAGAGVAAFEYYNESYKGKRSLRKNGLSYLLEVEKEFRAREALW